MEVANQKMRLGKSIIVPSVQELAKDSLESVPHRYIQPNHHQDPSILVEAADDDLQFPVIDMESLLNGDTLELDKLHSASQEWGFFQLINHGIDKELVEKFKLETQEFFNLPMEEKKLYWQTSTEVEGFGQAFIVSEEQKLDWADTFILNTQPKHLRKPNLLPTLPLHYRDAMELYSAELQNLAMKLLDCMSKALKIDIAVMRGLFKDRGRQTFRINCYPPCPEPNKVIGLTPHSDASALTILLQFDDINGLQIMKNGKWILIKPLPGAFVVNIGDTLEILSNGIYRSIVHRAVVSSTKQRMTVAAFHAPTNDTEIGPLPDLITPDNPARFRNISLDDYISGFFGRPLDGKSYLDLVRINESS